MFKFLHKHSMMTRVLSVFIAAMIVPYLLVMVFLYGHFRSSTLSTVGMNMQDSMISVAAQINDRMREKETASLSVYYDGCAKLLGREELSAEEAGSISQSLLTYVYSNSNTRAAYLVDECSGRVFKGNTNLIQVVDLMVPHYEEIKAARGRCLWFWTNELGGRASEYKFILARAINDSKGKSVGILLIVFDNKLISDPFLKLVSDNERYLIDEDGLILYCSISAKVGSRLGTGVFDTVFDTSSDKGAAKSLYTTAAQRLSKANWYCVSLMENDQILRNSKFFPVTILVLFLVYGLILLLTIQIFNSKILFPLALLKRNMDAYANEQLGIVSVEPVGSGEMRSLIRHFNKMTSRIDGLMEAYKRETEEKNRQKYLTLSAQMTPHFIYNSLNTIRWMALLNKVSNIPKYVESLIHIFRSAANVDEVNYTLKDELTLIEHYAVIQKERFANFDLVIDKDDACDDCLIKKLLLQPVVENAIVHGLGRGQIQNSEIRIRIWMDEKLHIVISDRGLGFDVEKWRSGELKTDQHTNIGLKNIEEIIRLTYGEAYSMSIDSKIGEGTVVTYLLPVTKKGDLQ